VACLLALHTVFALAEKPHSPDAAPSPASAASAASAPASAAAPANTASGPAKGKEIWSINDEDPGMQAAFRKAQATLDDFLAVARSNNPKIDNLALKIQVRDGKLVDYMWVLPFTQTTTGFTGQLNNVSRVITKLEPGQEVSFQRGDIVDWMYVDTADNTMHGNFTTCAMMVNAPASELKEMKTKYGLDCSQP
jgi:uncharacterized protein YegJ (DUF2314 family)